MRVRHLADPDHLPALDGRFAQSRPTAAFDDPPGHPTTDLSAIATARQHTGTR